MKIKIDGFHVRNVCRRCFWFSVRYVDGVCFCAKQNAVTPMFSSCAAFEYSVQADGVYSVFDRGKKLR